MPPAGPTRKSKASSGGTTPWASLRRSFFLQAAWNYRGQQSLGWTAAVLPALEKIYGRNSPEMKRALIRSLAPFNTHPYMSGAIIGALIKVEELGEAGGYPPAKVELFRSALMTAFAAIGDAFFWNALLPFAAVIGAFWGLSGDLNGLIVFLAILNTPHLLIRVGGFRLGYRKGLETAGFLDGLHLPRQAMRLRFLLAAALGVLAAWSILAPGREGALSSGQWAWTDIKVLMFGLVAGPLMMAAAYLVRRGLPVEFLIYGLLAGSVFWCCLPA